MGGPSGANSKSIHVSQSLAADQFRPEDYYQSSSCVNCHSTLPESSCQKCHSSKPFLSSTTLQRPSPCNAEMRWPDFLQTSIPEIQKQPWWVYQNFLRTQLQQSTNPISPQKIDLGLEIYLYPNSKFNFADNIFEGKSEPRIIFKPHLIGKGEELSVLLENQTLVELHDIRVKPSGLMGFFLPDNWLQQVGIKDGHPFLRAAIGALNLFRNTNNPSYSDIDLNDQIIPHIPIAYDLTTGEIFDSSQIVKVTQNDPNIKVLPTTLEIVQTKQFPRLIKLSEIYELVIDFINISKIKKQNGIPDAPPSDIEKLISYITLNLQMVPDEIRTPNFYARFHQDEKRPFTVKVETQGLKNIASIESSGHLNIDELFIPGWLHLDEAEAQVRLKHVEGAETHFSMDQISARFKPMDYLKSDPRKLGLFQIKEGEIRDGNPIRYFGIDFPPGISVHKINPDKYEIQANLKLSFTLELPLIGEVHISTPLLIHFQIKQHSNKNILASLTPTDRAQPFELMPQNTFIFLPDLELQTNGSKQRKSILSNLLMTDIPSLMLPTEMGSFQNGFWLSAEVNQAEGLPVKNGLVEMALPLLLNSEGNYDFENLLKSAQLRSNIDLSLTNQETLSGGFEISGERAGDVFETSIHASINQYNPVGKKSRPIIDEANIRYRTQGSESYEKRHFSFDANILKWGNIDIRSPHIKLDASIVRDPSGSTLYTIEDFDLSGNQKPHEYKAGGILRGPFRIRNLARPKSPLILDYNPSIHQLKIKNLALGFDVKRIALPSISRGTHQGITGIDMDGRIRGFWTMDTETYKGRGQLTVRGDKEGDISFRGKNGRRLEGILDPNDPQRMYEIPLLANTIFKIDRIDKFDTQQEQLKGHFKLSTWVDWLALKALGIQWNEHDEFTFEFDHLPYSTAGYNSKIREFFRYIFTHPEKAPKVEVKP